MVMYISYIILLSTSISNKNFIFLLIFNTIHIRKLSERTGLWMMVGLRMGLQAHGLIH